jgi:hypothetical protein
MLLVSRWSQVACCRLLVAGCGLLVVDCSSFWFSDLSLVTCYFWGISVILGTLGILGILFRGGMDYGSEKICHHR